MEKETNFDAYLEAQVKSPAFSDRFRKAGEAWDMAMQSVAPREASGISQQELVKRVGTSQRQISRLELPSYEGHSLSMLRRVADILDAKVHLEIIPGKEKAIHTAVAEDTAQYGKREKK